MLLRNDMGLLSEEYDVDALRLVGHFPQGLSHIPLVNSVHNLTAPETRWSKLRTQLAAIPSLPRQPGKRSGIA
jgi:hypothetical protein